MCSIKCIWRIRQKQPSESINILFLIILKISKNCHFLSIKTNCERGWHCEYECIAFVVLSALLVLRVFFSTEFSMIFHHLSHSQLVVTLIDFGFGNDDMNFKFTKKNENNWNTTIYGSGLLWYLVLPTHGICSFQ